MRISPRSGPSSGFQVSAGLSLPRSKSSHTAAAA
jgi:hypothetical protein